MSYALLADFIADYPAQPATAFMRAIEMEAFLRPNLPEGRGLDVGCGDGKLTSIAFGHIGARRLVGVDLDPLETAAAEACGLYESVHTCPAAETPLEDASFDFAISNSVLEHIPDVEPVLAEIGRLMRPGAPFVITAPTIGFRENMAGPLFGGDRAAYLDQLDARLAHFHYHDREGWRAMLDRAGFELEEVFGYLDRRECRRWETLSRFTGGLLYRIAGSSARPIELQRKLGLRQAQNRFKLPRGLAALIGRTISIGRRARPAYWSVPGGLPDAEAGCLLLVARKRSA